MWILETFQIEFNDIFLETRISYNSDEMAQLSFRVNLIFFRKVVSIGKVGVVLIYVL